MAIGDRRQSAGPMDPSFCVDGREVASSGLEALSGAKLDGYNPTFHKFLPGIQSKKQWPP